MKTILRWLMAAFAGFATQALRAEPLKTEYPKPMFVGTPVPPKGIPKILPPQMKEWQFDLPAGTANLSKDRKVTASDSAPLLGELSYLTDGDKSAEDGSYVELAGGRQWVQIDLGKPAEIHAILVWHYHLEARAYKALAVQISDDPEFVRDVKTVFNTDFDNSNGLGIGKDHAYIETNYGKLIDAKGTKGRYVRLYSNGNTSNGMNHYIEVEVWGK